VSSAGPHSKGRLVPVPSHLTTSHWKEVPGWSGFYVTCDGQIRGPSGRELRPMRHESGHLYVTRTRRSLKLYIHRAVLLAFVGPPEPDQETRHLNGQPDDNRLENLAWGTVLEQRADDRRNGVLHGHPQALTAEQAREIRGLKGVAPSRVIGARFGVSHTAILRIWRGTAWAKRAYPIAT
jgi:hypothetical protein